MSNSIEKQIELKAPIARVWRALTDHHQFGEWFRVKIEAPFVPGEPSRGLFTWPGYEHLEWHAVIQAIEPEHYFSFTWHPYALEPPETYAGETPTLVEFNLTETSAGTLLKVTESGFDQLPEHRRQQAFRMNDNGWSQQLTNIDAYVAQS